MKCKNYKRDILDKKFVKELHQVVIEKCVRTLLADEEFCERMAIEMNDVFGDFDWDDCCKSFGKENTLEDAKKALRNAAGMKEEK